jgi:hypothetical protein
MSSAELTLWARVEDIDSGTVSAALWDERSLFKTWAMRGTLHLLPSAEYGMWQAGWATYDHYLKPAWFKYFGMSTEEFEQLVDAVGKSLDGDMLTREQLAARVSELTGSPALREKLKESWGAFLKPASFQGKLCFAPNLNRNVRFTLPRWWLGDPSTVESEDALAAITRRFLQANGPATRDDYARWWFMSPAQALKRFKMRGDEAVQVEVEGSQLWMLAAHPAEVESAALTRSVNLLPAFDQYVIAATRHIERFLPGPFKSRIYRPQGWISPVLLVNGRMEGVWQFEKKGQGLEVSVEPFGKLGDWAKEAIEREAEDLGRFHSASSVRVEFVN